MNDNVNSPVHYVGTGIECIDAMYAAFGSDKVAAFCHLNAFKYLWRAEKKNGIEDLRKAQWYINKEIEIYDERDSF